MREGHALGLRTTATMVFGFGETSQHIVNHLERLRALQDQTSGFTAFICWPFQAEGTRLKLRDDTTAMRYLRIFALARLYLDNFPSLQVSWPTMGPEVGQVGLRFGGNDFGSAMIEENVVSQAGAIFSLGADDIERYIRGAGFAPAPQHALRTHTPPKFGTCEPTCPALRAPSPARSTHRLNASSRPPRPSQNPPRSNAITEGLDSNARKGKAAGPALCVGPPKRDRTAGYEPGLSWQLPAATYRNRSRTARRAAVRSRLSPPTPVTPGLPFSALSTRTLATIWKLSGIGISVRTSRKISHRERGPTRARVARSGGDPDAVRGRRVVPCATDSDESPPGVAIASRARSCPLTAAGRTHAATGPAPEWYPPR